MFKFNQKMTLIEGNNHTGKSSLIKSLYWTLGAEPADVHPTWETLDITSILNVICDGDRPLTFIREGRVVHVFDASKQRLIKTSRVSAELAPFMADLLGVTLRLANKDGEMAVPPPAYIFLPFYIDQDKGWQDTWSSFAKLTQFSSWQQDVIQFHTGQRTNEYYLLVNERGTIKREIGELQAEQGAARRAYDRLTAKVGSLPLAFDRVAYQKSLSLLLNDLSKTQKNRERLTAQITAVENKRILLQQQASVAAAALMEAEKDYSYASDLITDDVVCPTCGTSHESSFINRFSLIETVEDYRAFLTKIRGELDDCDIDRSRLAGQVSRLEFQINQTNVKLQERRGKLKLADVLNSEGEKRARGILQDQLQEYERRINELAAEEARISAKLKKLSDRNRVKEITEFFLECFSNNLRALAVHNVDTSHFKAIPRRVRDTGSEQPRAVLAYYAAILQTLERFSSTPLLPFVVDSPLQQEQDSENSVRILKFLSDWSLRDAQLILGTVSSMNVKFRGDVIGLRNQYRLLQPDCYDEAVEYLRQFGLAE